MKSKKYMVDSIPMSESKLCTFILKRLAKTLNCELITVVRALDSNVVFESIDNQVQFLIDQHGYE